VDPDVWAEIENCLALARETEVAIVSGERLKAARSAVDLARAYDRVLENIGLVPLSAQEQQRVRDQLAPVREQLRKYRLR
jgi:Tat protein secretion system quality control protein TatD with DNase activity